MKISEAQVGTVVAVYSWTDDVLLGRVLGLDADGDVRLEVSEYDAEARQFLPWGPEVYPQQRIHDVNAYFEELGARRGAILDFLVDNQKK